MQFDKIIAIAHFKSKLNWNLKLQEHYKTKNSLSLCKSSLFPFCFFEDLDLFLNIGEMYDVTSPW